MSSKAIGIINDQILLFMAVAAFGTQTIYAQAGVRTNGGHHPHSRNIPMLQVPGRPRKSALVSRFGPGSKLGQSCAGTAVCFCRENVTQLRL